MAKQGRNKGKKNRGKQGPTDGRTTGQPTDEPGANHELLKVRKQIRFAPVEELRRRGEHLLRLALRRGDGLLQDALLRLDEAARHALVPRQKRRGDVVGRRRVPATTGPRRRG